MLFYISMSRNIYLISQFSNTSYLDQEIPSKTSSSKKKNSHREDFGHMTVLKMEEVDEIIIRSLKSLGV